MKKYVCPECGGTGDNHFDSDFNYIDECLLCAGDGWIDEEIVSNLIGKAENLKEWND
ncbi:MAG: hypothetical protein QM689_08705 [Oscillospiraceae bacterium]